MKELVLFQKKDNKIAELKLLNTSKIEKSVLDTA